jgi:hypothetical protein
MIGILTCISLGFPYPSALKLVESLEKIFLELSRTCDLTEDRDDILVKIAGAILLDPVRLNPNTCTARKAESPRRSNHV